MIAEVRSAIQLDTQLCQRQTHRWLILNKAPAQAPKWVHFLQVSPDKANTECPERPQKIACYPASAQHQRLQVLSRRKSGEDRLAATILPNTEYKLESYPRLQPHSSLSLHILPSISHSFYSYHIPTTNNYISLLSCSPPQTHSFCPLCRRDTRADYLPT